MVDAGSTVVHKKISIRMQFLLFCASVSTAAYAATFSVTKLPGGSDVSASSVIVHALGQQANNLAQLVYLFGLMGFLAILFPEDLDSPTARKWIGALLAVSNVSDMYVVHAHATAYAASSRPAEASVSYDKRVCLYIHLALLCFFFCWGVVYPTIVFFFLHNSWTRLRTGLTIDAFVFLTAYALLWVHGEERYPPGDAPLDVALFGRPAVALLGAAAFTKSTRLRLARLATEYGFFHVKFSLDELPQGELRTMFIRSGLGEPIASGNDEGAGADHATKEAGAEEVAMLRPMREAQLRGVAGAACLEGIEAPVRRGGLGDSSALASDDPSVLSQRQSLSSSHYTAKLGSGFAPTPADGPLRLADSTSSAHARDPNAPVTAAQYVGSNTCSRSDEVSTYGSLGTELDGIRMQPLGFEAGVGDRYRGDSASLRSASSDSQKSGRPERSGPKRLGGGSSNTSDVQLSEILEQRLDASLQLMSASEGGSAMKLVRSAERALLRGEGGASRDTLSERSERAGSQAGSVCSSEGSRYGVIEE